MRRFALSTILISLVLSTTTHAADPGSGQTGPYLLALGLTQSDFAKRSFSEVGSLAPSSVAGLWAYSRRHELGELTLAEVTLIDVNDLVTTEGFPVIALSDIVRTLLLAGLQFNPRSLKSLSIQGRLALFRHGYRRCEDLATFSPRLLMALLSPSDFAVVEEMRKEDPEFKYIPTAEDREAQSQIFDLILTLNEVHDRLKELKSKMGAGLIRVDDHQADLISATSLVVHNCAKKLAE